MIESALLVFESRIKHRTFAPILTALGLNPVNAHGQREAINACTHRMPHIIIVDAHFLGTTKHGLQIVTKIRALEGGKQPKIVMLFDFKIATDEEAEARKVGVDLCCVQTLENIANLPATLKELLSTVRSA